MAENEKKLNLVLGFKVDESQARAASKKVQDVLSKTPVSEDLSFFYREIEKQFKARGIQLGKTIDESIAEGLSEGEALEVFAAQLDEYAMMAEEITQSIRDRQAQLKAEAAQLRQNAETIQRYSQGFLIAGGAITGGFIAAATRYIATADKSDKITKQWLATSEKLNQAQQRIGKSAAQVLLPIYEKLGNILDRISRVAETNPKALEAIFGTGVGLTLVGVLGMAVSRGIRMVADVKMLFASNQQLIAGQLMSKAAKDQLAAAGLFQKFSLKGLLGKAGLLTAGGGATLAGGLLAGVLGVVGGAAINDLITKKTGKGATTAQFATVGAFNLGTNVFSPLAQRFGNMSPEEAQRKTAVFTALIGKLTGALDESSPLLQKVTASLQQMNDELSDSEKALREWQREDKRLVEEANQERLRITEEYNRREKALRMNLVMQLNQASAEMNYQSGELLRSFNEANQKAEADYQQARAEIIADSSEQIQDIERDHQRNMEQMVKEHNQRSAELIAARDALGYVKEQRRFADAQREAERQVSEAIAREQEETAKRLEELSIRHREEAREREKAYEDQRRELSRHQGQVLQDLRLAYLRERQELRNAKQQELQELQAALERERYLKMSHYNQIIRDLGGVQITQPPTYGGGGTTQTPVFGSYGSNYNPYSSPYDIRNRGYAAGGYARGPIMTGEKGYEFVMSHDTTRAAEKLLGGTLSQQSLMRGLQGQQIIINDYRKFENVPAEWDRRKMNEEMRQVIREVIS